MWKKDEQSEPVPEKPRAAVRSPVERIKERALIGASISINGDLSGEEDLVVQGQVSGAISFSDHSVTIGKQGRAQADVFGKVISVEGEVEGNLFGEERIVIRQSGNVRGDLHAPQVILEEGCKFKGSIDMDAPGNRKTRQAKSETKTETPEDSEPKRNEPKRNEPKRNEAEEAPKVDVGLKMGSVSSGT